jgi:hypothetical protein
MKKFVSALLLTGSLAFFGTGTAQGTHDGGYTSEPVQGSVSEPSTAPGETVIFSGEGFFAGEDVDITADHEASEPAAAGAGFSAGGGRLGSAATGLLPLAIVHTGTATADANGDFSYPLTLEEEGVYTLTATGRESSHTVTAMVVVDAALAGTPVNREPVDGGDAIALPETLADTGMHPATLLWMAAGLGALTLGAGTVMSARRRTFQDA